MLPKVFSVFFYGKINQFSTKKQRFNMVPGKRQKQQLAECSNESLLVNDEIEQKFKEMRIKRSPNPRRQTFFEIVKEYFRNEQEL